MKKSITFIFMVLSFLMIRVTKGQDVNNAIKGKVLNVFIDKEAIDEAYMKENFIIVNYVRDPVIADVQILVNTAKTGSGGLQYNLVFLGKNRFSSLNDTIIFHLPCDETTEKSRKDLLEKIKLGLVPFLMKTPSANRLFIEIDSYAPQPREEKDSWKNWMFEVNGSAFLCNEQLTKSFDIMGSLYVNKITPKIKFESLNQFNYGECHYSIPVSNTDFEYINMYSSSFYSGSLFVKSLGNHFGIGSFADFMKNQAYNIDLQMGIGPAIEYNLYKYADAAHKQCRILYSLVYKHSNYTDLTIYNKMNDQLYTNNLSFNYKSVNKWGDFCATINGSSHLDNFSYYSLGATALTRITIAKGLSFDISVGLNMHQNLIGQRKGFATLEEVLTNQREIESSYDYSFRFGISYRFGSIYNNTVNPRFEY